MAKKERVITDKNIKSNNFEFKSNNEEFNSNKQIEEMACDMCGYIHICNEPFKPISTCSALSCAEKAYTKGYRKESEVVKDILNLLSVFNKDHSKNHSIKIICTRYGIDTKKYIGEGSDNGREQS